MKVNCEEMGKKDTNFKTTYASLPCSVRSPVLVIAANPKINHK